MAVYLVSQVGVEVAAAAVVVAATFHPHSSSANQMPRENLHRRYPRLAAAPVQRQQVCPMPQAPPQPLPMQAAVLQVVHQLQAVFYPGTAAAEAVEAALGVAPVTATATTIIMP